MAEHKIGRKISNAVVTVPAYYDDKKRQATKKAAQLADLEVVRIVNEPTAAAMAYGIKNDREGTVLVFDLGGGTFDVSILNIRDGVFEVLATCGDTHLGGDDFDLKIVDELVDRFRDETDIDLRNDKFALQKVYEEAEKAKKILSDQRVADIEIPFIAADDKGPLHLTAKFTRIEFEELITGYIEKTLRLTKTALREARRKKIPIVAICDTNVDPTGIDYPIPGNDDSIKSLDLIISLVCGAVKESGGNKNKEK